MVEREEVFSLYSRHSTTLYVDLECNGEKTAFFMDTGCGYSTIGPEHLEKLGKSDKDLVGVEGSPMVLLDVKLKGTIFPLWFFVEDNGENLLGMDILCMFSCLLNLEENTLTFREYVNLEIIIYDLMYETVIVEGQELKVMLDTGTSFHIVGTMETAKQLNLKLEDVSGCNSVLVTNDGTVPVEYAADNVRMKVRDRELGCGIYMVCEEEGTTTVGIAALHGALIQFYPDGTYEISLSGELDIEEEVRVLEASNERRIQYTRQQEAEAEEEPPTSVSD